MNGMTTGGMTTGGMSQSGPTTIREITIISGKGGTGKTTLAAAFATLAFPDAILADCDVDAADLHLILKPEIMERTDFRGSDVAQLDEQICIHCGLCAETCRFGAITDEIEILREKCEGCGVCELICPVEAMSLSKRVDGELYSSETRFGPMVHARLRAGGEASGKLVAEVRNKARLLAVHHGKKLILSDGPPGIGCPVISAISGTDLAVVITEPTISGISDLKRVLDTAAHFHVISGVVINKSDVNPERSEEIRIYCEEREIPIFGRIPYDMIATESMVVGESIIEYTEGAFADTIRAIWHTIHEWIGFDGCDNYNRS